MFHVTVNGRTSGLRYTAGAARIEKRNIRAQFPHLQVEIVAA